MPSLIPEDLASPGAHALVIGVSRYLHFADGSDLTGNGGDIDMEQLSAALLAHRVETCAPELKRAK